MRAELLLLLSTTLLFSATSKLDENSGLVWQDDQSIAKVERSYSGAIEYCKDLKIDGFDDWRLPTLKEFYTIVDLRRNRPAIKGGFEMRVDDKFWTTTLFVKNPKKEAWRINMSFGEAEPYNQNRSYRIRCVRG